MKNKQIEELILQALEQEVAGVEVYTAALRCAVNPDLKEEWGRYLEQTRTHAAALRAVCDAFGIDAERRTSGREVVRGLGLSLVQSIDQAREAGDLVAAEIVACECVLVAETKDHLGWSLLARCVEYLDEDDAKTLEKACDQIEEQEDEHLYRIQGWCRELWMKFLGMKAPLPPPEEQKQVRTAIGAARAAQAAERQRH